MIIFKQADALSQYLKEARNKGRSTGFVPTMGALHAGHLSLIEASRSATSLTVCSIFVNPTQFNNPEDFKHYPITIDTDIEMLISAGTDILFLPSANQVYPAGYKARHYDLGFIETVLEGHYRPGHFQGVCQVVDRLLQVVEPDKLFMGQKDFQQCLVVRKLLELTGRTNSVELVIGNTVREENGLAMSSRNLRLQPAERELATTLFRELSWMKAELPTSTLEDLRHTARMHLEKKGFQVDYFEIANAKDLSPANDKKEPLVALVAAGIGPVRLIDNLLLN
jgi:pantoate--beta-alanine ligase